MYPVLTKKDQLMAGLLLCWPLTSVGAKLYWFWAKAGLCIYEQGAGLQWRQADVSISISTVRRLGWEESALAAGACLYYLAKKQRSIGVMRSAGVGRRGLWSDWGRCGGGGCACCRCEGWWGGGGGGLGGGSMASTISLIDRVSKRGLFF